MKNKLIISIFSISAIVLLGILLPSLALAQNADEKVTVFAEKDCKKIAERLGDPVPAVRIESNFNIPYEACVFRKISSSEDEGLYYASKTIEDVKMVVHEIEYRHYSTVENAINDLSKEMNYASEHIAQDVKDGIIVNAKFMSVRKVPDGYVYVSKFHSGAINDETSLVSEGSVHLLKGSCQVRVEVSSPDYSLRNAYHKNETVNLHPGFNHDREAEVLELARQKAEELLNLLDCDDGVPSSKNNSVNKSNYTQALVIEPPKESDFKKVKLSGFKKVNPVSTASAALKSATPSANITDSIFLGKVGGEGKIIIDLPGGDKVTLTDDQTAFDGRISIWRFIRDFNQSPMSNSPFQARVIMRDCHLDIRSANEYRWASDWSTDRIISTGNCDYTVGGDPTRILVDDAGKANFKTSSGVNITAENADFGIGYDTKSGTSVIEIYNGSVKVTNKSGQAKTISAVYGSQINQAEVNKDGVMTEKIAIPQSEWEAFLASQQEKEIQTSRNNLSIAGAVTVLGVGGLTLFLYRTGRLIPLYKTYSLKISELIKKTKDR